MFQRVLRRTNNYFREKEEQHKFTIDPENHVIDKKHGVVKNFMRLTNKALLGFSRVKINKAAFFSGFLGLGLGYLAA